MTPACVASASKTSAAARTTGIIKRIRIELGIGKIRARRQRGFEGRSWASFPPRRTGELLLFIQPSLAGSYKHYAALFASDGEGFRGPKPFPHNPQQPVGTKRVITR